VPLLIAGCRASFPGFDIVPDEAARRALAEEVVPPPVRATMVQRWVLRRGDAEVFFALYLRVRPPDTLEVAVLSDLGTTLAAATLRDGIVEVHQASRVLPRRLAEDLLLSLDPLFLAAPAAEYRLVRLDDGTPALLHERDGRRTALARDRVVAGRPGRRTMVARVDRRGRPPYPAVFRIEASDYDATVHVAEWAAR
jgi:hypothetical protein